MSKSNDRRGGIGFLGMLAILFIGLKLTGHIAWPWLWVLAPLWFPLAAGLSVFLVCCALAGFLHLLAAVVDAVDRAKTRER